MAVDDALGGDAHLDDSSTDPAPRLRARRPRAATAETPVVPIDPLAAQPLPTQPLAAQPQPSKPSATADTDRAPRARNAAAKTAGTRAPSARPGARTAKTATIKATPAAESARAAQAAPASATPAAPDRSEEPVAPPAEETPAWLTPLHAGSVVPASSESWADLVGGDHDMPRAWFEPPELAEPTGVTGIVPIVTSPSPPEVAGGSWFEPPGPADPAPTAAEQAFFGTAATPVVAPVGPGAAPGATAFTGPWTGDVPVVALPAGAGAIEAPARLSRRARRQARKPRARRVVRIVRRVDPWSVLKISLVFFIVLYLILLVAGVLAWAAAVSTGTIDNVEGFITKLFALDEFSFDGAQIFRASWIGGLILVAAGTFASVMLAVLFNLISDLVGGMRFTVLELEVVRRTSPARPSAPTGPVAAVPSVDAANPPSGTVATS